MGKCACPCGMVLVLVFTCVQLFVTLCTVAHQTSLSIKFSRQEHWSGLPFPLPGDFPDPGIEPASPALAGGFFTTWESPNNANMYHYSYLQIGKLRLKEIMSFAQVSSSDPGTHVSLALSGAFILNWVQRRFDGWRGEGSWQDNPHGKGFCYWCLALRAFLPWPSR